MNKFDKFAVSTVLTSTFIGALQGAALLPREFNSSNQKSVYMAKQAMMYGLYMAYLSGSHVMSRKLVEEHPSGLESEYEFATLNKMTSGYEIAPWDDDEKRVMGYFAYSVLSSSAMAMLYGTGLVLTRGGNATWSRKLETIFSPYGFMGRGAAIGFGQSLITLAINRYVSDDETRVYVNQFTQPLVSALLPTLLMPVAFTQLMLQPLSRPSVVVQYQNRSVFRQAYPAAFTDKQKLMIYGLTVANLVGIPILLDKTIR